MKPTVAASDVEFRIEKWRDRRHDGSPPTTTRSTSGQVDCGKRRENELKARSFQQRGGGWHGHRPDGEDPEP